MQTKFTCFPICVFFRQIGDGLGAVGVWVGNNAVVSAQAGVLTKGVDTVSLDLRQRGVMEKSNLHTYRGWTQKKYRF